MLLKSEHLSIEAGGPAKVLSILGFYDIKGTPHIDPL